MDFSQTIFFDVEQRFSKYNTQKWMNMWWTFCFYISAVYVVIVHWGQNLMTNRKKFYLRRPLFLWNLTLACFSAIGFYRVGGKFLDDLERYGWHQTICSLEWLEGQSGLWCALFGYSKVLELLDTSFIILRKQKLIFLHWYHHITVLCFCWYAYIYPHGQGRVFIVMNYFVHTIMYAYYAIRAQGLVRIPLAANIAITCLQLSQMVFGVATFVDAFLMLQTGVACNVEYMNILIGLGMYVSYAILFSRFFYLTYVKREKK